MFLGSIWFTNFIFSKHTHPHLYFYIIIFLSYIVTPDTNYMELSLSHNGEYYIAAVWEND